MATLDETDKKLLHLLQENAKYTIRELAEKLFLTTTPVYERIRRLEREGVIKGYSAILDKTKVGRGLTVFSSVTLKEHSTRFIERFEEEILHFPEVQGCYHCSGAFDFLLKVLVPDMESYQQFISKQLASLEYIGNVQSYFVMKEIRDSAEVIV